MAWVHLKIIAMNLGQVHWFLTTAWRWLVSNFQGVLTVVISLASLWVIWRTQKATSEQAKAARTQNNMSIHLLHATLGSSDRQLMPLLTVKAKSVRSHPMDPNLVQVAEVRNAGLGPALEISIFLEAREVSGKLLERVDLKVETTFLPVDGTMDVPFPPQIVFQPFVIEYLSAMNSKHETRFEFGAPNIQSHKVLHTTYTELSELRFD